LDVLVRRFVQAILNISDSQNNCFLKLRSSLDQVNLLETTVTASN